MTNTLKKLRGTIIIPANQKAFFPEKIFLIKQKKHYLVSDRFTALLLGSVIRISVLHVSFLTKSRMVKDDHAESLFNTEMLSTSHIGQILWGIWFLTNTQLQTSGKLLDVKGRNNIVGFFADGGVLYAAYIVFLMKEKKWFCDVSVAERSSFKKGDVVFL